MKVKLKEDVTATGESVAVWHSDVFGQNLKIVEMYTRATLFLLEKGWSMSPLSLAANNHNVIWVENVFGEPMGAVIYEYHPQNKQCYIVLIFTDDKFRGQHVYTILQTALEEEAVRLGATSIASMAHKDNVARLKAGEREGMTPQFLRLYKDLSPNIDVIKQTLTERYKKPWNELSKERWTSVTGPGGRPL